MRVKTLLGLAACAAAAAGALTTMAPAAQAASLPCNLTSDGNSASVTCYSGSPYTWRLVVDCQDTSNPWRPVTVSTYYGAYVTGDGTETHSCGQYKALGHIEAR